MKKSKNNSVEKTIAISAGVAAMAAASYFLFGPKGTQNRKKLKGWMIKMKGEVIEEIERLKEVSEPAFHAAVDTIAAKYAKYGKVPSAEIASLAKELKKSWKSITNTKKKKVIPKKKSISKNKK